jgi:hypothetical protein
MLAQARKLRVSIVSRLLLVVCLGGGLGACATQKQEPLISDNTGRESAIPWNQQQKWENQGQLGPMAERFETRR